MLAYFNMIIIRKDNVLESIRGFCFSDKNRNLECFSFIGVQSFSFGMPKPEGLDSKLKLESKALALLESKALALECLNLKVWTPKY
jgi:hypothetical protein